MIDLSNRLDYTTQQDVAKIVELEDHIGRMLTRLIKSLQSPGRR